MQDIGLPLRNAAEGILYSAVAPTSSSSSA
jgi:hypothetical protein